MAAVEPWDLREAQEALAYWRARRRRLGVHRRRARREADHMVATWEEAVRHSLLRCPDATSGERARAAVLVLRTRAGVVRRRWTRRLVLAGAAGGAAVVGGFAVVDALLRNLL